jgi:uncharacterized protein involved in copper resistance
MPVADAARTVVGPDHAAAPVVIGGIVVAAAVEVAVMVKAVAVMEAASVPASMPAAPAVEATDMHAAAAETSAVEATAMEATAMEAMASSTMKAAAVEAATMASTAMTSTAMASTKAHVSHEVAGCGFRCRHRTRTERRHRFGALTRRSRKQQHRCRCETKAAREAAPWICNPHHVCVSLNCRQPKARSRERAAFRNWFVVISRSDQVRDREVNAA